MIRHGVRVKRWLLLSFVFSVKGRRRQTQGGVSVSQLRNNIFRGCTLVPPISFTLVTLNEEN